MLKFLFLILTLFIYLFCLLACYMFAVKKNTGLTRRLRSDKKDASSPISFFNFLSFSSFCYRRGLGERLTIHAITCQENQNKIHKLQINELGVLMTTQEQVDRSVFLCITRLFSCFWRRFCFSCCFSWESSHNLNKPIYLHDLLRFSIIDCYSDIDDPINRWSQTLRTNSPLWKRVIAWERSRAASGYGIIWGDADRNKQEEFSAECHSVDCF